MAASRATVVGVISDTHGLLRPEACAALAGADLIVHAGDIGDPRVLAGLAAIAPLHAVRGNIDRGAWADAIDTTAAVEVNGQWLYVLHDLRELDLEPRAAGFAAVIAGHSHRPRIEERGGVLYVNPGSAGPRRFKLPIALARLRVTDRGASAEILELGL
jgi:putative phosphoesterase